MPRCDRCTTHVIFVQVRSATGKLSRMPVNEIPDPDGNVAVGPGRRGRVVGRDRVIADSEVMHMPHFATCPNYRKPAAETKPNPPRPEPPATLFDQE